MLKIITKLSMFLIGTLAQAQVSEARQVNHFSKIVAKDGVELVITQSDRTALVVEAQDALSLNGVATEVKDNTLYVYTKDASDASAKVFIETSELSKLEVSGASRAVLTKEFNTPEFSIALSSKSIFTGTVNAAKIKISLRSGSLYNGSLTAQDLVAALSGSATARLSGWAASATISADSKSKCYAKTLYSAIAHLDANGNSTISANVERDLEVNLSEGSKISWAGFPSHVSLPEDAQIEKSTIAAFTGL